MRAEYKPIWFDEALTWHISRLPNAAAIMSTLYDGADQNLPLTFWSVRGTHALFGNGEWATRLPAIAGVWLMLICLFFFLRKRLPLSCALTGALFPMLTFAGPYAYEARGYGLMLGGAGLALLAWQTAAAEERSRSVALPLISIGFAVALTTHYTGALLAIPFGAAELVRDYRLKRVDFPMWIAFLAPSPIVLFYPKLMAPALNWDVSMQAPTLSSLSFFLAEMFYTAVSPLIVASGAGLAAYGAWRLYQHFRGPAPETPAYATGLRSYEVVALAGFMAAPLVFFVLGFGSHHFSFATRYGLICVIGAAGLVAALLAWVTREHPRAATAFVVVLSLWMVVTRGRESWKNRVPPAEQFTSDAKLLVGALQEGLPVVVVHWNDMVVADFYLPHYMMQNAYYVRDRNHEREYKIQTQANEVTFRAARHLPWHGHFVDWSQFRRQYSHFLVQTREDYSQWMFDLLAREGWQVTLRGKQPNEMLFEVTSNPTTRASQ